jgi:hypothetical protein
MATRKLVLGSAANLLVVGVLVGAGPVLAQQSGNDPALAYGDAKARYEQQLQDYNRKQQAYEQQRSEYNAKIDAYQRALSGSRPADTVVVVDDADPDVVVIDRDRAPVGTVVVAEPEARGVIVTREDDFAQRLLFRDVPVPLVRLENVVNVNNEAFNAPVVDAAGIPIGHFRRLEVKDSWGGNLAAVVTLNGSRRTISMLSEHVRFDPDRRIVIADLTARQIDRIPSGFPYG